MTQSNFYQGSYKYNRKPVITTAPDAFIFLNGKRTIPICTVCNNVFDPDQFVTTLSTSLSIDGPGNGTCTLSLNIPRNAISQLMNNGFSVIQPMMEIEIFMKGYFLVNGQPRYYPSFWGVVVSISESYSGGFHTFSIQCKDMLHWWGITKYNFTPALLSDHFDAQAKITGYATSFKDMNVFQIMVYLSVVTMNASILPTGTSLLAQPGLGTGAATNENVQNTIGQGTRNLMQYWASRNNQVARALRIFGATGSVIYNGAQFPTIPAVDQLKEIQQFQAATAAITGASLGVSGDAATQYSPFYEIASSIPLLDTDGQYQSKLEIAVQIRDFIGWEFYLDTTGEFIFKPPFYNLDVKPNFPVSWLRDTEILDWNFEEAEPAATRVEVSGAWTSLKDVTTAAVAPQGIAVDYNLLRQFGVKSQHINRAWLRTSDDCFLSAVNELDRITARRFDGTVTIIGRPELRLGFPVYIESRDAYYYISDIQHSFNYGGVFTTTLGLIGRRLRYSDPYFIPLTGNNNSGGAYTLTTPLNLDSNGINRGTTPANLNQNIGIPNAVLRNTTVKNEIDKYVSLQAALIAVGAPVEDSTGAVSPKQITNSASNAPVSGIPTALEFQRSLDRVKNGFALFAPQGAYVPDIDTKNVVNGVWIYIQTRTVGSNNPTPVAPNPAPSVVLDSLLNGDLVPKGRDLGVIPVSDSAGYELIGLLPYGRGLNLQPAGTISGTTPGQVASAVTAPIAANLVNMVPTSQAKVESDSITTRSVTSGATSTAGVFHIDQTTLGLVFADMQPTTATTQSGVCACKLSNQDLANLSFLKNVDSANGQIGLSFDFTDQDFAKIIGLSQTQIQMQLAAEMKYQSSIDASLVPQ